MSFLENIKEKIKEIMILNKSVKYIVLLIIIFLFFIIFLIIISFYVLKWFDKKIDYDYFLSNDFNKESKKILEKYGNIEIKEFYLMNKPCSFKGIDNIKFVILNMTSMFRFSNELQKYLKEIHPLFPNHTSLVFKLKLPNNEIKMLQLEKGNHVLLNENFSLYKKNNLYKIKLKNKTTINKIINKTIERIGSDLFFKWSMCNNNCQTLMKELLITTDSYEERFKKILICQADSEKYFSSLTLYAANCWLNFYNMMEYMINYIMNN